MNEAFVKNMPKLGFGLMRLPQKDGEIDLAQTCEMVDMFLESVSATDASLWVAGLLLALPELKDVGKGPQ